MTTHNFLKLPALALLFSAIISPLSALAATNSAILKFVFGTNEVISYDKLDCTSTNMFGGTTTGIGTGTIIMDRYIQPLDVISLNANDCITVMGDNFKSEGDVTFSNSNGVNIVAHYSTYFIPTSTPGVYKYKDFTLKITGGTGLFERAGGMGSAKGASNIYTGLGVLEGIMYISK